MNQEHKPKCPYCGYEGNASNFMFDSVRADRRMGRKMDSDTGVVCCPNCDSALGGYTFRNTD